MLNPILRLALPLTILFMLLTALTSVVGAHQTGTGLLSGLVEHCAETERSCWYGIVPGATSLQESDRFMQMAGYEVQFPRGYASLYTRANCADLCTAIVDVGFNQMVTWLEVRDNAGSVRLGDLLATIGTPDGVIVAQSGSLRWCYRACRITINAPRDANPFTLVDSLFFRMASDGGLLKPWRGFIPFWRRCQLEIASEACI